MGFGHRVYKNFDPRAKVMKATADEVLKELNISDPVLDVAKELEHIALNDEYFIEKKLYPNVDFYSGVILNAIGFPTDMFTALFALARTVGWVAQWNEMISDPEQKIGRPRQLYVGATQRDYVPVSTSVRALGRVSVKRAPSPGALSSVTSPPIERASRREMARPRPVPPSSDCARSKRSKMRCWSAGLDARTLVRDSDRSRAGVRVERQADGAAIRRVADRVADEVDEDLDDRRAPGRSPEARPIDLRASIVTLRSSADGFEHHDRFGRERGEIDRAVPMRRILAHRADDREQMAGRGGDVVAVARIIAAQRPVGALDDPLGAFDDAVERRAQHFVERMVEMRRPPSSPRAWLVRSLESQRCRESRRNCPSAAVTTSPLRTSARLSSVRLRAFWPVKAAARRKRADQRHFAARHSRQPQRAGQRLPGRPPPRRRQDARRARAEREISRSSSSAAHSLRGRGVSASDAPPSKAARRGPAAERARSSLRATSTTSSPSGVAWTHSSMSCSVEAATAGRRHRNAKLARELRDGRDLRQRKRWPIAEPAWRCSASSSGIGGDQAAGLVEAADDGARFRRSAGHVLSPKAATRLR